MHCLILYIKAYQHGQLPLFSNGLGFNEGLSVVSQPENTDPLEKIICLLIAHISAMESFTDVLWPKLDSKSNLNTHFPYLLNFPTLNVETLNCCLFWLFVISCYLLCSVRKSRKGGKDGLNVSVSDNKASASM